jgi:hypothetical protein
LHLVPSHCRIPLNFLFTLCTRREWLRKVRKQERLYALRKQIPEPVFGIIKSVLGFRQFLLRGINRVRGEWSLVTVAWNKKRMFVLRPA